jgi:hypothetical protein
MLYVFKRVRAGTHTGKPVKTQKSESLYDWWFTAPRPLRLTTSNFIFQLNICGYSPYVTSSLTIGWVCRLQLLLALARAVILGSESCEDHEHILLSQIQEPPPNWRARSPYLYAPGTGWPGYTPQALGSLFVASYDSQDYGGGILTRRLKSSMIVLTNTLRSFEIPEAVTSILS